MTLRRFEEPHPPTPLSASREGGVFLLVAICRERGVFLPLLACGEPRRAGVPPVEATAEEGLGVGFSAAGIYKENLQ